MKKWILGVLLLSGVVMLLPWWEGSRELPLFQRLNTAYVLSREQLDTLPVLKQEGGYPEYLTNSQNFATFCQGNRDNAQALRILEDGFQYTGNRVTEVGEYGLPVTLPRFHLDGR